jgi:hypothetical protein
MVAAVEAAKTLKAGQRCVVLLADGVRNYMTKFLNNEWMWQFGYVDVASGVGTSDRPLTGDWTDKTVADLKPQMPFTVQPIVTCKEAVDILSGEGFDQLPVVRARLAGCSDRHHTAALFNHVHVHLCTSMRTRTYRYSHCSAVLTH